MAVFVKRHLICSSWWTEAGVTHTHTHTHTHTPHGKMALAKGVCVTSAEVFCSAYTAQLRPQMRRNYASGTLQGHGYLATNYI